MKSPRRLISSAALASLAFAVVLAFGCSARSAPDGGKGAHSGHHAHHHHHPPVGEKFVLSEDDWKKKLTPEQYYVLREQGTERAWTGALLDNKEKGTYRCAGCGAPLFDSDTKYNSGSGWPSFYKALAGRVLEKVDTSHGMVRTEIICARCGGHLGHKFPDGPRPTGQRFCVNSLSMEFDANQSVAPAKK